MAELVANSGRGLDASDESYYLLAVRYPHAARMTVTGFDSYLAPIWWLSGRSIARYRIAGLVILVAAVVATARLCSRKLLTALEWSAPAVTAFCAIAIASLSLSYYTLWITTPGYNLVVLTVALVVAGMTASLAMTPVVLSGAGMDQRLRLPMEAALGFALSVGLVVKAPAFIFILMLSTIAIVITRGSKGLVQHWRRLTVGFVLGLLTYFCLTGLPWEISKDVRRGLHANGILGGHTSDSIWEITLIRSVYGPWFLRYLLGAAALAALWRLIRRDTTRLAITTVGSLVTAVIFATSLPDGGPRAFSAAGWWWVRLAAMMLLWSTANVRVVSRKLALGPLIALMAVGAAAGSSNGLIREVALTVGLLGVGLVVHGLVVLSLRDDVSNAGRWPGSVAVAMLPIAAFFVVGCLASSNALEGALHSPYRLNGSLRSESERVDLGEFGTIDVNPATARYVRQLQVVATQIPDDARDCLVDLAGGTPLSAIALGVRPAALPWIIGGYPGSKQFADYVLRGSPCLAGSYVLIVAPSGSRAIAWPAWLDTSKAVLLGRAEYDGYLNEVQFVWLVPASQRNAPSSGN